MNARAKIEPRLLSQAEAARYCGVGVAMLKAECPVIPIKIRSRVLYDRQALDRWIDARAVTTPESGSKHWLGQLDNAHADKRR
jgi:hypothetical protein